MTGTLERSATAARTRPRKVVRLGEGQVSFRYQARSVLVCGLLIVAVAASATVAIGIGDYPLSPAEVIRTLLGHGEDAMEFIVLTLRLPRVLTAIFVGAALALSGAVFQSLSRNPLGSPDIIGFTTGAATGAVIGIIVFSAAAAEIAMFAIAGGIVTALVVYFLAWKRGVQGYRLILVGIGVAAMLTSVNSYLLTRAELNDAMTAQVWLTGTLNGRGWEHVRPISVALLVLIPLLALCARRLSLLEMGDDQAKALGIPVERSRLMLIIVAVALSGVATASAGPVGFIALAAPQVARRLLRSPGLGLASAAWMGALMVLLSDIAAQRLFAPTQLPVGVMTGAVGGVYLAWLLARGWRANRS